MNILTLPLHQRPGEEVTIIPALAVAVEARPNGDSRLYLTGGHRLDIDLPREELVQRLWGDRKAPEEV